jgi:hypothetical protein
MCVRTRKKCGCPCGTCQSELPLFFFEIGREVVTRRMKKNDLAICAGTMIPTPIIKNEHGKSTKMKNVCANCNVALKTHDACEETVEKTLWHLG